MPVITLPDGSQKTFDSAVSVYDVAHSIGEGLARASLAGKVNDQLVDVAYQIETDADLSIITSKDPEGLEVLRHSCAHLMAQAVKRLFPEVQVTIGPVIEDGFYYDFASERSFTPEDLITIQKEMKSLIKQKLPVERSVMSRNEAIELFKGLGEHYKVELIEAIPEGDTLTCYKQGDFIDLCRGPHVPNTGLIKAFKLTQLAGAYWRGNSDNEMLQRIYGTAWADKASLNAHLERLEEAKKRDHRKIAKQMDLFHIQDDAPGMIFWHHNGWVIYREVENFIREQLSDYEEIKTPQIVDSDLWKRSGHWDLYGENMFFTESESRHYAVKPMSCPCHVQVFNQGLKSYRDLPLRLAEFGNCHRNEASGTLHGLMRVRNFVQDDAHVFCTQEQIQSESLAIIKTMQSVYKTFGFEEIIFGLSTRPEKRIGEDALWDRAEEDLKQALETADLDYVLQEGDGAFYGPKIDFSMKDCLGRLWQIGTLQLDYSLPERLGAQYVAEDGSKQTPVMIHRALLGSVERFIGILTEHYAGKFPLWLAPKQVVVMTITEKYSEYATKIVEKLQKNAIRVKLDLRNEKIGYKIREHTLSRIPVQLIIGESEMADKTVSVRLSSGKDLGAMSVEMLMQKVMQHIEFKKILLEEFGD
jgi:threonyl-tRNA synthetase